MGSERFYCRGEMCSLAGSFLHGCEQNGQCDSFMSEVKTELKGQLTRSCSLNFDDCDVTPQTEEDNLWVDFWADAVGIFGTNRAQNLRNRAME